MTAASTRTPNVAAARRLPQPRDAYAVFRPITTRWADNDEWARQQRGVFKLV